MEDIGINIIHYDDSPVEELHDLDIDIEVWILSCTCVIDEERHGKNETPNEDRVIVR